MEEKIPGLSVGLCFFNPPGASPSNPICKIRCWENCCLTHLPTPTGHIELPVHGTQFRRPRLYGGPGPSTDPRMNPVMDTQPTLGHKLPNVAPARLRAAGAQGMGLTRPLHLQNLHRAQALRIVI